MRGLSSRLLLTAVFMTVAATAGAQATGSRLSKPPNQPTLIVRFEEPAEIARVRDLINGGRAEEAVGVALDLLATDTDPSMQYFGNNALCVAYYSSAKNYDNALMACDKAVGLRPAHWMALNSRGTLHLVAGRLDEAMADYEKALSGLPKESPMADIVRHNIELVNARRDG